MRALTGLRSAESELDRAPDESQTIEAASKEESRDWVGGGPCACRSTRRPPRKSGSLMSVPDCAVYCDLRLFPMPAIPRARGVVFRPRSSFSPHSARTRPASCPHHAPIRFERVPEMAKAKSQSADVSAASATKKRPAAASEIDDIFAKKPKATATATTPASGAAASSTTSASEPPVKKAKQADKSPTVSSTAEDKTPAPSKRVPETVVDTSKAIEGYKPAPLEQKTLKEDATEEEKKAFEEEERFRDSRGLRAFFTCVQMTTELTPASAALHRSKDGRWTAHL